MIDRPTLEVIAVALNRRLANDSVSSMGIISFAPSPSENALTVLLTSGEECTVDIWEEASSYCLKVRNGKWEALVPIASVHGSN